jgi:HEAT repeat protein
MGEQTRHLFTKTRNWLICLVNQRSALQCPFSLGEVVRLLFEPSQYFHRLVRTVMTRTKAAEVWITVRPRVFRRVLGAAIISICCFLAIAPGADAQVTGRDSANPLVDLSVIHGSVEQKRDALLKLRNMRLAEASRAAIPALSDSSEIVRATAAGTVVFLPPDEAANVLLPLLGDKSAFVRKETAYALGSARAAAAEGRVATLVTADKDIEVRDACAVALGEIGDTDAVNVLNTVLNKKAKVDEEFLRRASARSIGQIAERMQGGENRPAAQSDLSKTSGDFAAAAAILIHALDDAREFDDVKREAAFALGAIGTAAAIPSLTKSSASADYYLAKIARDAISKIPQ